MELEANSNITTNTEPPACYHCGLPCFPSPVIQDEHFFCCTGCVAVYEILGKHGLEHYYRLVDSPGRTALAAKEYTYLDEEELQEKMRDFAEGNIVGITLHIPNIHCISCIWLLENLYRLKEGIRSSTVNFVKKQVKIIFDRERILLSDIISILESIGYPPRLSLENLQDSNDNKEKHTELIRLGIAGFCFGNVMLFSFPEYLAAKEVPDNFRYFFSYVNLFLSIPALFYCGWDWLRSAVLSVRHRFSGMDLPIALGLLTLFVRSLVEVLGKSGVGYFDSLCGFVFFLLLGRFFQKKTFDTLSFDNDYKSYFPLSTHLQTKQGEKVVSLEKLEPGDIIRVRNQELVPADCVLESESAMFDYSFITGETTPITKKNNESLLAGAKVIGVAAIMKVKKSVSQSFLTGLWNNQTGDKKQFVSLADAIGSYFTVIVLAIAFFAAIYWSVWQGNSGTAFYAFSSVLIVACPCALALSSPFCHGALIRILGRHGVFVKEGNVLEKLSRITTVVFDKTGTLTRGGAGLQLAFGSLNDQEKQLTVALAAQSSHPVSRALCHTLGTSSIERCPFFREIPGKGLEGEIDGVMIVLGRIDWVIEKCGKTPEGLCGQTAVAFNGEIKCSYYIKNKFRENWQIILEQIKKKCNIQLISGDNDRERNILESTFDANSLFFQFDPFDKSKHIKNLQDSGQQVAMIADGLNDAGALDASDVGISVMEDSSHFSPACDIIISGTDFAVLPQVFALGHVATLCVRICFALSLLYNIIGICFAFSGKLSPLLVAVLMPLSSLSVMVLATISAGYFAGRKGLN